MSSQEALAAARPHGQGDRHGVLPPDFEVPELLETDRFRIRPLTIHDVVKDYDAVMRPDERVQLGRVYIAPPTSKA